MTAIIEGKILKIERWFSLHTDIYMEIDGKAAKLSCDDKTVHKLAKDLEIIKDGVDFVESANEELKNKTIKIIFEK